MSREGVDFKCELTRLKNNAKFSKMSFKTRLQNNRETDPEMLLVHINYYAKRRQIECGGTDVSAETN